MRNSDRGILVEKRYVHKSMKAAKQYEELRFNRIGVRIVHMLNFNIVLEIVESRKN